MVVEFDGFVADVRGRRSVRIRISGPHRNPSGDDYFFELSAPEFLLQVERIFGADEDQARRLSVQYLAARIDAGSLLDRDGRRIGVSDLFRK